MKYVFTVGLLFVIVTSRAQFAMSPAEEIVALTKTKESTRQIVNLYIDAYKKKKQVPEPVWNSIASQIDYSSFMLEVKALYENNFSDEELKRMADYLHAQQTEKFVQLSKRIEKDLYSLSNNFGKKLAADIETKLKNAGY
jgi:hypothetical protein